MLGKELLLENKQELQVEKEYFKVICFIIRGDKNRYKNLFSDLKCLDYRGRDEYTAILTAPYDLLVRESGEFENNRTPHQRFDVCGRGARSGR